MDPKTWKKFWSASTLSSFTFGSTIGTQRPEKGHWIKTKAAIGWNLRDRASMPQWIWRHFPSFSCFQVLKSCVQNIFNILRWYCAKCNFTGDWSRMGLKRNRPKFGSRHCPLGLTWSNHQENHHHQKISDHQENQHHQQKISLPNSCHLQWIKYDHMIHGLIRWWNSGRKLSVTKRHAWSFPLPPLPET